MDNIANMLTEELETKGKITFQLTDKRVFDRNVKDMTVFYKLVGDSRFKLFRSNGHELVFVHLTEDWMRQSRVDLDSLHCAGGIEVILAWDEEEDTMSVRGIDSDNFVTVTAMQIDN